MIILKVSSTPSPDSIPLPAAMRKRFALKDGEKVILTGGFRITRYTSEIEHQLKTAGEIMAADRDILRRLAKQE